MNKIQQYTPEFILGFKDFQDSSNFNESYNNLYEIFMNEFSSSKCYTKINNKKKLTVENDVKSILNKISKSNLKEQITKLFKLPINNYKKMKSATNVIFDKIIDEPNFIDIYSDFIFDLNYKKKWIFRNDYENVSFLSLLIDKCQDEFNEILKSIIDENNETYHKQKDRRTGTILLICELYKKKLLANNVIHQCISKLISYDSCNEKIDLVIKIIDSVKDTIAKEYYIFYTGILKKYFNDNKLQQRVKFNILDLIESKIDIDDEINTIIQGNFSKIDKVKNYISGCEIVCKIIDLLYDMKNNKANNTIDVLIKLVGILGKKDFRNGINESMKYYDDVIIDVPYAKKYFLLLFKKLKYYYSDYDVKQMMKNINN